MWKIFGTVHQQPQVVGRHVEVDLRDDVLGLWYVISVRIYLFSILRHLLKKSFIYRLKIMMKVKNKWSFWINMFPEIMSVYGGRLRIRSRACTKFIYLIYYKCICNTILNSLYVGWSKDCKNILRNVPMDHNRRLTINLFLFGASVCNCAGFICPFILPITNSLDEERD